ncbi:Sporulation stage 0, Spo0E-like regulatory phosphatase [Thermaerobacter marianensis DSM 12885]|uniref:Sporulation stage 0, Spo0E-like regulatory phosphatase n=1 Tax=Thermaerobacter marianensis (strain ATCC 700841 / DSM 12885 / JCM 10246 / 7p75a) TaxID=644966 RepID=E6SMA2_THEM7|nr:aspartyl-phosphate phosphatase Spo0E family protein [Thermaerobacter marianensis]ADU51461.1 Sporulation stage 0, Spo0E-like regulatory phosphatase [Thermaerobacter marianensis DSM 12885]
MASPVPSGRHRWPGLVEHRAEQAEIERLRNLLYRLARRRGYADPQVVELSRQLDDLITAWYRAHGAPGRLEPRTLTAS